MSRYGKSIAISKIYDSQGALVAVLVMSLEPVGLQVGKIQCQQSTAAWTNQNGIWNLHIIQFLKLFTHPNFKFLPFCSPKYPNIPAVDITTDPGVDLPTSARIIQQTDPHNCQPIFLISFLTALAYQDSAALAW
ncbi:hypothetical protein WAI453_002464 [Rhynchosporium graminicola]